MDILQKILRLDEAQKKRLDQNGIKSVNDFISFDTKKISRIISTDIENVKYMKQVLQKAFKIELINSSELLQQILLYGEKFRTKIENLDEILPAKGLLSTDIVEITGPPGAGKTFLLYTIMLNLLEQYEDINIFFIDTKYKFSSIKLKNMLIARDIPELRQIQMMKRIQIEKAKRGEDVLKTLQYIYETPMQHEKLKVIMVDSITVPYYTYIGHTVFQLGLLTQIAEIMRLIIKQNIAILVTNLANHHNGFETPSSQASVKSYSSGSSRSASSSENQEGSQSSVQMILKPATGQYWESVAHHRVLIDFLDYPHNLADETGERQVSLFSSKTAAPSESLNVNITEFGIV